MDNYVIWEPERNGHAPPFWKDGMEAEASYSSPYVLWTTVNPKWGKGGIYRVPSEAVNGPQIDDSRNDAEFDVQAWLAEGRANADKLPAGVVLPEPPDWAMEVAVSWLRYGGNGMEALAAHIRTHCQPREVSNG